MLSAAFYYFLVIEIQFMPYNYIIGVKNVALFNTIYHKSDLLYKNSEAFIGQKYYMCNIRAKALS